MAGSTVTVGCVVAQNYRRFVPAWLASVRGLERKPDEVVVVTDIATLPDWVRTVPPPTPGFDWVEWHRHLFDSCTTDWVSWVNADDTYLPTALNDWPEWRDVDVAVMGNQVWTGYDNAPAILEVATNYVPCGSPFRLSAYRRSPGVPELMPYADWGLWVGMAKTGARFRCTGRRDYLYRFHPDTPTELEPTRTQIRFWAASL